MDSLLLEVVQSVDDFDLRPTQSVQLGDTEEVSFTEHRETGTELVSLVQGRGAADLLKEDLFASICFEVFHLRIGGLMGGGAPCVSDLASHVAERTSFLKHSIRTPFRTLFGRENPVLSVVRFRQRNSRVSES